MQELLIQGLQQFGAIAVLAFILFFLDRRIWPWFTQEYWPSRLKAEAVQTETLQKISEAIAVIQKVTLRDQENHMATHESLLLNATLSQSILREIQAVHTEIQAVHTEILHLRTGGTLHIPPSTGVSGTSSSPMLDLGDSPERPETSTL